MPKPKTRWMLIDRPRSPKVCTRNGIESNKLRMVGPDRSFAFALTWNANCFGFIYSEMSSRWRSNQLSRNIIIFIVFCGHLTRNKNATAPFAEFDFSCYWTWGNNGHECVGLGRRNRQEITTDKSCHGQLKIINSIKFYESCLPSSEPAMLCAFNAPWMADRLCLL